MKEILNRLRDLSWWFDELFAAFIVSMLGKLAARWWSYTVRALKAWNEAQDLRWKQRIEELLQDPRAYAEACADACISGFVFLLTTVIYYGAPPMLLAQPSSSLSPRFVWGVVSPGLGIVCCLVLLVATRRIGLVRAVAAERRRRAQRAG